MKNIILCIGLFIVFVVLPVSALDVIVYPSEYYAFNGMVDKFLYDNSISGSYGKKLDWYPNIGSFATLAASRELRRQTILLEKQNELIAEANHIMWINTCYAPHSSSQIYTSRYTGNISALKQECINAGYPTIEG